MFEQYANILQSEMPHLEFEGVTYPPPRINEILSNVVFVVRMVFLLILMAGPGSFTEHWNPKSSLDYRLGHKRTRYIYVHVKILRFFFHCVCCSIS